ncbi:MAG: glycosyltransferase family 4 protein [Anaerolineales bacterium]|nr:glycosyltransferase family 4 protein [Anaerolineales bacterium]GER80055.1 conserved hypothetical protein [Candidatus Denitrolinea symbiosum]
MKLSYINSARALKTALNLNDMQKLKIAYIHTMTFPNPEANAFDAVWSAAALSETVDTTFFMPRVRVSADALRTYYGIPDLSLQFQAMYLRYFPDRFWPKFNAEYYEKALLSLFRFHPRWMRFHGNRILYVRDPKEVIFWGEMRKSQKWLWDWIFLYEAHTPLGLDPNQFYGDHPFDVNEGSEGQFRQRVLQATLNFDEIICNTQTLADDLRAWTHSKLKPRVIRLASPLPRLSKPPVLDSFGDPVILGYIGTIDQYRGVNILLDAMRYLPHNFRLRLVGRFREEKGVDPNWLDEYTTDPEMKDRIEIRFEIPIRNVLAEIDNCDILLQPASKDIVDSRYATPQKSFGYMVRGKPIVVADVPCHKELFQDGENVIFYPLDPRALADRILFLVKHPNLAKKIAEGAWKQSVDYTFSRRASEIISLAQEVISERSSASRNSFRKPHEN